MDAEQLLQSLAVSLNLPTLRFDANGCARIAIEGAPALNFERDEGGVLHVYSVLGRLPHEGREAFFTQMLQGNLFGASTGGATLAIDDLYGEIVLCRTVLTETASAPSFAAQVELFVDAAQDWQTRLNSAPASDTPHPTTFEVPRMMDHAMRG